MSKQTCILYPKWCKTSSVGQSAGLLIPRSSVRSRQKLKKPENSNLHGFDLHRPSNKGTKLLLQVIKAIINQNNFHDSTCERWNLRQVCNAWAHALRLFWTKEDQSAISSQVVQVYGSRTLHVKRQLKTPFLTCLTSDTWQETNTWYTCAIIGWAFKESLRMLLVHRGIVCDRQVAHKLWTKSLEFN